MGAGRGLRHRAVLIALAAVLTVAAAPANGQGGSRADALEAQSVQLYQQGKPDEAAELLKQALAARDATLPASHPAILHSLDNLAMLYEALGRLPEVEPLNKRALSLREKALPPNHPEIATRLNNLGYLYRNLGRLTEAETLHKRALAMREKALLAGDPEIATSLSNLAGVITALGRLAEAEPLYRRALQLREAALPAGHPDIARDLNNLAVLHTRQGRLDEAEPLLKRSLQMREAALPAGDPDIAQSLDNLAAIYDTQGRLAEAEPLYKRALQIYEAALPAGHPDIAQSLNNLAFVYQAQGRLTEAEPLYQRALKLREAALPAGHPDIAQSLNNLAALQSDAGRLTEAETLYQRALKLNEGAFPAGHPDIAISRNNLAGLFHRQGRLAEAERLFLRVLQAREAALWAGHPHMIATLNNLGVLRFEQRDWARAADYWRRSTAALVQRSQRGTDNLGLALTGKRRSETERGSWQFRQLAKAAYRLAQDAHGTQAGLLREMFLTAQWAQGSEAAGSLAQMAARGTKGDAKLAVQVRERQDLVAEWQSRDAARSAAVSQLPDERDRPAEAANTIRLAAIDARIAAIDKRLVADFPDYTALSRPTPLSVEEVQAQLGPGEVLVLFLDTPEWQPTPEETFVWAISKTDARWARSQFGTPALTREVAALRCGLDAAMWDGETASAHCRDLVKRAPERDASGNIRWETLPFDAARAHALYKALFGQVEDLIRDKHLLIVPSGPLTQLPFQALVTTPSPSAERAVGARPAGPGPDHRGVAWLARNHAVTVLPAVSSLKALRRVARPSAATRPMIGFGNPLLDGDPSVRPWEAEWARLARTKQACPQTLWQRVAGLLEQRRGVVPVITRNGQADLEHLRLQMPLHDTADELCAVAKDLKLQADDIVLGARATEAAVKKLSTEGRLASYRVVHFATHGTLAGDISGTSEPGLILTPPAAQSEADDGYLSASEVAALKLDADWVILSACNTAAGGAQGAGALSGLARAFFYAGARALLVSHWSVDSAATVKLITSAVGTITRDAKVGRAEALRRAMLAMIDTGEPREAHPAYWAPFVVVGEGAPPR